MSQGTLSELEGTALSSKRTAEFARIYDVDAAWLATALASLCRDSSQGIQRMT